MTSDAISILIAGAFCGVTALAAEIAVARRRGRAEEGCQPDPAVAETAASSGALPPPHFKRLPRRTAERPAGANR